MKRLYVIRHSKAGQSSKVISNDNERKLTKIGVGLCERVAKYLIGINPHTRNFLSSSAVRAKQTTETIVSHLPYKDSIEIEYTSKLYLATSEDIFDLLKEASDDVSNLAIVGHNPGIHQFAIDLSGSGNKDKYRAMKNHFLPPSVVTFDIDISSWKEIAQQKGKLVNFVMGRDLPKS